MTMTICSIGLIPLTTMAAVCSKDCEPTRATVIEDEVKGYGWKVIGIYEVQNDGRLSQKDYRKTVYGGGYVDYWFESDSRLIRFPPW